MATQSLGRELSNREFFIQRWEQEYSAFVRISKRLPADRSITGPIPAPVAGELVALLVSASGELRWTLQEPERYVQRLRWSNPLVLAPGAK